LMVRRIDQAVGSEIDQAIATLNGETDTFAGTSSSRGHDGQQAPS
jgi:hypothetical protein